MADMLVNLLALPPLHPLLARLEAEGIHITRPVAPDKHRVLAWIRENSNASAASECDVCFSHTPHSCFVALQDSRILGYACYDAIAPDFFGPTRVLDACQGRGIGKALLLKCLHSMREAGYVYAIIGGIGPAAFYEKTVGATLIPHSTPGIYRFFMQGLDNETAAPQEEQPPTR